MSTWDDMPLAATDSQPNLVPIWFRSDRSLPHPRPMGDLRLGARWTTPLRAPLSWSDGRPRVVRECGA